MFKKENLILVVGAIALIYILRKKKPKTENKKMISDEPNKFDENDAKNALEMLAEREPKELAKIAERVLRWETNHFRSKQYRLTGSAGMEVGAWKNLPSGMESIPMIENNTGKTKRFIVWGSPYSFLLYFVEYVKRHNGNWARWYSTDAKLQAEYRAKVNTVKNRIVV
jgi:hypothetical protein